MKKNCLFGFYIVVQKKNLEQNEDSIHPSRPGPDNKGSMNSSGRKRVD